MDRHRPTMLMAAAVLAACVGAASAEPTTQLYVNGVAPFAYSEHGQYRGVLYDMLVELNRRTGNGGGVTPVPLRRAQQMALIRPDALASFARYPEIEQSYQWLCKLADDKVLMIGRTGSGVDITSADAAKHLRVGVLLGGPAEALARRLGFTHIETVTAASSNARKLALGRIDVWITAWSIAAFEQRGVGGRLDALRAGAVLQTMEQYLAGPRGMDPQTTERWKSACAAMRKDGTHAAIMRRYDYATLAEKDCSGPASCAVPRMELAGGLRRSTVAWQASAAILLH